MQTAEWDASVFPSAAREEAPGLSAAFKDRHVAPDIILRGMRWYCRYTLNYGDLEGMMAERHLSVDHTTIYHWAQHYA